MPAKVAFRSAVNAEHEATNPNSCKRALCKPKTATGWPVAVCLNEA